MTLKLRKEVHPVEIVGGTEKLFVVGGGVLVPQGVPHCVGAGLLTPVLLKSSKMYPHDLQVWATGSFRVSHIGHFFCLAVPYFNYRKVGAGASYSCGFNFSKERKVSV